MTEAFDSNTELNSIVLFFLVSFNWNSNQARWPMVSALVSGSSGPGSSSCRGHYVVFLDKTLYSAVPLSTQVYKFNAGGTELCDGLAFHPGGVEILSVP